MKRIIFPLVIVLMLVVVALLAVDLPPIDAEPEELYLECLIIPDPPELGQVTNFYAAASGGTGDYSWSWTVNGTEVATTQNAAYTFTSGGNYTVCITVTDSAEQTKGPCCTPVTITEDLNLTCNVSPNPTKVGHETNFTVTAGGGSPSYSYFWDFGDGVGTSTDEDPTYIYTTYGDYNVCVNVTDSSEPENEEQCCTPVTVNPPLSLECDISPNPTEVGQVTSFYAGASGGVPPYFWSWTVNGAEVATTQNTTHTFTAGGTYNVSITVTDSLGNVEPCPTLVTVTGGLNLTCDVSPNPTKVGHETNFTVTASGGVSPYSYFWDFGDGVGTSMDEDPTYIYTTYGDYNVCVNVTDSLDNKGLCCTPVTVNPPLSLECDISPNPTEVGQITNFYAGASGGVPPYFWSWTVNGAEIATDQNTTHIFTVGGTYNVSITVTDSLGNVESCPTLVTVTCELPTAEFSGSPRSDCAPLTVVFTDLSTGATSWSWDVDGDGNEDYNTQNPSHIYTSPGTYTVSLNVSNACGSDTETKTGYITAKDCTPPPSGGGGGGGSCPAIQYLTVDWDGKITEEPLNTNNRLAVDLLGPNPDGRHSLLLERGTLAPIVDGETQYLIVIREFEETLPLPENTVAIVTVEATPDGAVFDRDIFLTLGFNELPENIIEGTITIAYYDDGVWVPLESVPGEPSGVAKLTLSAPIKHFSIFGVLVELEPTPVLPPAHFVPSDLSIVPSVEEIWESVTFVTKTGESVTITANVLNDGGQEGTYTVELKLNGETVDTKAVTLGAGQSQPVSFTVSELDYGHYEVEVAGLSGDFTTSRTVTWWLIIVLIVAVGLIIWGVVWWWRRRGRKPAQEES